MKSSLKYLSFIVLFFTFSFVANAQRNGTETLDPNVVAEKETTRMIDELGLNQTQASEIKEINLTYAKQKAEAREKYSRNRSAFQVVGEAIENDKAAEIKTVLTQEQYKAFEKMQAQQVNRKGQRGGGRRGRK